MNTKVIGFLQAVKVTAYCLIIGIFFSQAPKIFPEKDPMLAPVAFLLLFSASVLICALIVFYKPYKLFFAGKKNDAVDIVLFTAVSLLFFAVISFPLMLLFK